MEEDLISVIIPVYNCEKYIEECLNSIINQTYKNLEIIVVNDGSSDKSLDIINNFKDNDSRVNVISTENKGVSHARNVGLNKATGKYISFVDSDDWLDENFCTKMHEKLIETDADLICCGYNKVTGEKIEKINSDGTTLEFDKKAFLIKLLNVQTSLGLVHMKLIKAELVKKVSFNENLKVAEDALYNMGLCEHINKAAVLNEPLYNYRINTDSVVRKYDENYSLKYEKAMNEVSSYIKNNYYEENVITNLNNFIVYHLMLVLVNFVYNPENKTEPRIKLLKEICISKTYKEAIKYSNYNELSLTRKITLFTIKYKLYIFTALICMIRQRQIRS